MYDTTSGRELRKYSWEQTIILTGTPAGCGFAQDPPVWLKAGDVIEVEIEGIGVLRNSIMMEE